MHSYMVISGNTIMAARYRLAVGWLVRLATKKTTFSTGISFPSSDLMLCYPVRRRRRSRSRSSSRNHVADDECPSPRTILMSDQEALHQLYGEITTVRDGAVTHQCVQTNLADVICGGEYTDIMLFCQNHFQRYIILSSSFC